MSAIAMKYLLEAGVHFGHQTKRWDPKMEQYIYTSRGGIYIIDLQKTTKKIDEAYKFLSKISERGGKVLFVGTRKQAQNAIKDEAIRSNSFYITQRWLGGTLTNFKTIRTRVNRLEAIEKMEADGTFAVLPKKEVLELKKESARLERFLGGIRNMKYLPDALFVVDPKKEKNAILEARILGIPVVGIVDTNCDPDDVDFVIPANDDAIKSVKLISVAMANAINEPKGDAVVDLSNEDSGYVFVDDTPRKPRKEYNNRGRYNNNRPGNNRYGNNAGGNNNGRPSYNNNRPDTRTAKPAAKVETPKVEVKVAPKVEAPKVEAPKVEAPKVEAPKVEAPKVEVKVAPKVEAPKAEQSLADLKAIAKEKGIKGYSTMKKAELIDALK